MQFQAEMNLLDTINESLRSVIDVDKPCFPLEYDSKKTESEISDFKEEKCQTLGVAEVQTQTVNDIATQTEDSILYKPNIRLDYSFNHSENAHISMDLEEKLKNLDGVCPMILPYKMKTMSEISLHETTSSIKTESGTEISISTRDITCSFNKNLDLQVHYHSNSIITSLGH